MTDTTGWADRVWLEGSDTWTNCVVPEGTEGAVEYVRADIVEELEKELAKEQRNKAVLIGILAIRIQEGSRNEHNDLAAT